MSLFNDQLNSSFKWFVGIIEDINDPLQAGRVKVRCFGIHTSDKKLLPTDDLPWASIMSPTSNSNFKGVNSPVHSLIEGTNVVGFFMDGDSAQHPLVMGSLPGLAPTNQPNSQTSYATESRAMGFIPNQNDYGTLATSTELDDESHPMTRTMDLQRKTGVLCAGPAQLPKIDPDDYSSLYYERPTWDEPPGRGGETRGFYPHTKTYESSEGHVTEVDDNPDNPRLLWYHKDGTFEEFTAGGRQLKVIGSNYEVVLGKNNVYIHGDCNLTVAGDMRQLVQGNYFLEVVKDYTVQVHGSMKRQISFNDLEEIRGTQSTDIQRQHNLTINGVSKQAIGQGIQQIVGDKYDITVTGALPAFAVQAGSLPGLGLIQLNSAGVVDIVSTTNAKISGGLFTSVGDESSTGTVKIHSNVGILLTAPTGAVFSNSASLILSATGTVQVLGAQVYLN